MMSNENFNYKGCHSFGFEYRLAMSDCMREKGNDLFKSGDNRTAIQAYRTGLTYLFEHDQTYTLTHDQDCAMGMTAMKMYNNLSAAYLRIEDYREADNCATAVLQMAPTNTKGLYRKGLALKGLQNFHLALTFLECALRLEPDNERIMAAYYEVAVFVDAEATEEGGENESDDINDHDVRKVTMEDCSDDDDDVPSAAPPAPAAPAAPPAPAAPTAPAAPPAPAAPSVPAAPPAPAPAPEVKKEHRGKRALPGWVKWVAGAAAVVGAGLMAYKYFK